MSSIFLNRRMKCLNNPTENERLDREPFLAFSFYLSSQNNILLGTIDTINEKLNNGFSSKSIKADCISDASVLLWFWSLAAYEVVRTMCQAKECFSAEFYKKIEGLKNDLSKVRMPTAKMEKQGKKIPVLSNRSPDGWDYANKDLLIGDPDDCVSGRWLMNRYDTVMSFVKIQDIKGHHAVSYVKK
jgi:hypothetical protein